MTDNTEKAAISFPCQFPVKAIGNAGDAFTIIVLDIFHRHIPNLPASATVTRPSSNGKYVSITVTFMATSQAQLDALYRELSDHPDVLMAL